MPGSNAPRPRKNKDTLHNEAWLRQKYEAERLSARDIAALLGCAQPTVFWALRKFAIPVRTTSEGKRGRPSTAVWTDEARENLAAQRRGSDNPAWTGDYHPIAHKYGLTKSQYLAMQAVQQGHCAICGKEETARTRAGAVRALAVDHDHETGRVRELLCQNCNFLIGHSLEDPDTLRRAATYLERHRFKKVTAA